MPARCLSVPSSPRKYRDAWYRHRQKWKDCIACPLGKQAEHHVFARGQIPCTILFIGEAPGESEDVLGVPFVGPAGKLLDKLLDQTEVRMGKQMPPYAITNTLCCFPQDEEGKPRPPDDFEVDSCMPRLSHFVRISRARCIVGLGKSAQRTLERYPYFETMPNLYLKHPAYFLRSGNETEKARFVIQLASWVSRGGF